MSLIDLSTKFKLQQQSRWQESLAQSRRKSKSDVNCSLNAPIIIWWTVHISHAPHRSHLRRVSPWQPSHPACDETPSTRGLFYDVFNSFVRSFVRLFACFLVLRHFTFPASDVETLIIVKSPCLETLPFPPHGTTLVPDLWLRIAQSASYSSMAEVMALVLYAPRGRWGIYFIHCLAKIKAKNSTDNFVLYYFLYIE